VFVEVRLGVKIEAFAVIQVEFSSFLVCVCVCVPGLHHRIHGRQSVCKIRFGIDRIL
jgi:hypothetical protein